MIQALAGDADYDKDRRISLEEISLFTKQRVSDFVRANLNDRQMPERVGQDRGLISVVALAGSAPTRPKAREHGILGLIVLNATPGLMSRHHIAPDARGILVEDVLVGLPAHRAELRRGDLITPPRRLGSRQLIRVRQRGRSSQARHFDHLDVPPGRNRAIGAPAPATAEDLTSRLLRIDPQDAAAFRGRGRAFLALGNADAAIADLSKAIHLDPQDAEAHDLLGQARSAKGDLVAAVADYDEAIRIDPKSARYHDDRGKALNAKGLVDEAIDEFTEATRLDPDLATALWNRAGASTPRGTSTAPSPATARRSTPTRSSPWPTTPADTCRRPRAGSTRPSPTSTRRSASTRGSPWPTGTAGWPTSRRRITTAPSPTMTRRSDCNPDSSKPLLNRGNA